MALIGTEIRKTPAFQRNKERFQKLMSILEDRSTLVRKGGGEDAVRKQHAKNKLTARERVERLVDPGTRFMEIGLFAGYGMYEEYGEIFAGGTIVGIGSIHGRDTVIVANDATVKAGAWFPITCRKNLRAQEIAMENRLSIVYLVDSAGIFLPLQNEVFPDKEHFGRIFRNNAVMSAMGINQIAAVMGPCVAGGAYLPVMSDETIIVEGNGSLFLAGSHLVKAAIGEEVENEQLGGAMVHTEISGVADHRVANDAECLSKIRSILSKIGSNAPSGFNREISRPPLFQPEEIEGILPDDPARPYDMLEVLARLVDGSEIDEYKEGYGKTLITGYARIDGWAVGVVANQRSVVKTRKGEMQVGGVIYSDRADKAARFIMNCNQKQIPLVFFQDVTGFMVGSRAEHGGIIKDGAKMISAVANSVVPKFTVVVGNSFGAGNYAMCGRAYDPRLMAAWPTARIAVMGGRQASETLLSIRLQHMDLKTTNASHAEHQKLLGETQAMYERETDPYFAAAHMWIDDLIRPSETREYLSRGIGMASNNPEIHRFNPGVIQT